MNEPASWLQSALALAFVLALVIAAGGLLKRLNGVRGSGTALLRPVATLAVGTRERIVIVEAAETWLVLGVAPGRVSTLHVMPRREGFEPAAAPAFPEWLSRALARGRAHEPR